MNIPQGVSAAAALMSAPLAAEATGEEFRRRMNVLFGEVRVPVRIVIDEPSPRPLIAGLSTHVTVHFDNQNR